MRDGLSEEQNLIEVEEIRMRVDAGRAGKKSCALALLYMGDTEESKGGNISIIQVGLAFRSYVPSVVSFPQSAALGSTGARGMRMITSLLKPVKGRTAP